MNVLISTCLMGVNCKYNGGNNLVDNLDKLIEKCTLIPVCPEQMGGLSTPRNPCEIVGQEVISYDSDNCTEEYVRGAEEAIKLMKLYDCKYAILKAKSPSCGYKEIYDGTFSHTVIEGNGVFAQKLLEYGVKIYTEDQIDEFINNILL